MKSESILIPENHTATEFLRGQASKIFEDVAEKDYFASIVEAQTEIAALKDELMDIQGAVTCPQCGVKQAKDNSFCSNCGASLLDD